MTLSLGIKYLMEADEVWGHNFLSFDTEFIREIYPFLNQKRSMTP